MIFYRRLFGVSGLFSIALGAVLVAVPHLYLSLYTAFTPDMAFPAQRFAPAIVGLGALLLLARDLPKGAFAARFACLSSLVWFGVAATGALHYFTGVATSAILIAAAIEVALGVLFLHAARTART